MPAAPVQVSTTLSANVALPAPGGTAAVSGTAGSVIESAEKAKSRFDGMNEAIRSYFKDNERFPNSLQDLVKAGYLSRVPSAPDGKRYDLDPKTGQVFVVNK
jgi:hypothetical protein